MKDQNKPLHVIGAYDYLELIVMSVEPISRFETLRAIRSTCRQFMFVTAPLMRYELRVSRRYRTWFDDFTTFGALPLWTLVTSIRITSAFTDVNDDLRTMGTYLPYVESICIDLLVNDTGGSSDYLCTLEGLCYLRRLESLRCFGVTGLNDSMTLALDDAMDMVQWPTLESGTLSLDVMTSAHVRLSHVPSLAFATLRLRASAVTALIDCGVLYNVRLSAFILARDADDYTAQQDYTARRGVSEGRLSSLLRVWTNLTSLVMHDTICALSIARAIGDIVSLVSLVWYSDIVARDWDDLPVSPTVPRWSGTPSDRESDPYYDPRREVDVANSHKASFIWLLENVIGRLPMLRSLRFGCGCAGIQSIGSGWNDDGELYPLWKIAGESGHIVLSTIAMLCNPTPDAQCVYRRVSLMIAMMYNLYL
ncbi:hypothetical protein EXIGLDRAFT_767248 [Exidia glandulosa HHB12029]|uniref:Uncharacterized protein n=1 Tax=Exidia glandulosa HHB12029 TaxID=1314781 RepID=A0A165J3U3_EXIGL|nr:hypothetical protein EXIGLDRAFT_767248 [Exidia glandulosa HHB12029]